MHDCSHLANAAMILLGRIAGLEFFVFAQPRLGG